MRSIFAHGPWYTEWHHLIDWIPAAFAFAGTGWAWFKVRVMFRGKDRGDE